MTMHNMTVSQKVLNVRGAVNITLLSKRTGKTKSFRIRKDPTKGYYKTFLLEDKESPVYIGAWSKNHYGKLVYRKNKVRKDMIVLGDWLYKYIQHPALYNETVTCTLLWQNLL